MLVAPTSALIIAPNPVMACGVAVTQNVSESFTWAKSERSAKAMIGAWLNWKLPLPTQVITLLDDHTVLTQTMAEWQPF